MSDECIAGGKDPGAPGMHTCGHSLNTPYSIPITLPSHLQQSMTAQASPPQEKRTTASMF